MLIRNVKSYADLEKKRNLQAQILQVQIDNESMLESRVKDYQNPNKPPPVPPRYKTNSELAQDTNFQQKEVIDNLLTINGVDNILALGVSQGLAQLPNGVGNFLIFNKNFPIIKKRLEDISKRSYSVQTFMEKIEELLQQIELGILYQSTGGVDANVGFNMGMGGALVLPSGQTLASLGTELQAGANPSSMYGLLLQKLYEIQNTAQSPLAVDADFISMLGIVEQLCEASPETDFLQDFDLIEQLERQKLQRDIGRLTSFYKLPKYIEIEFLIQNLVPAQYIGAIAQQPFQIPQDFERAYSKLLNRINGIKAPVATSINELRKVRDKITALLGGQVAVRQQLQGQLVQAQQQVAQQQAQLAQQQAQNAQILLDKDTTRGRINAFQTAKNRTEMTNRLVALGILQVGLPQVQQGGVMRDVRDEWLGQQGLGFIKVGKGAGAIRLVNDAELLSVGFADGVANIPRFLSRFTLKSNFNTNGSQGVVSNRYTTNQLLALLQPNIQQIQGRLNTDPAFNPEVNQADRIVVSQGFGVRTGRGFAEVMKQRSDDTNRAIAQPFIDANNAVKRAGQNVGNSISKFFGGNLASMLDKQRPDVMCPAVYDPVMKNGKMYSNACEASAYGSGLICPQNYAPVRAKDGKIYGNRCKAQAGGGADENYKVDGMGFINRKIKIGRGIAVEEQPRYRTFGKYIIHMPYLENDNVLNVKFKSMGSIPSIKPVSIDDNFKEFILDIMNTGGVNQKHYNSLTEPEKTHFHKIVKGAGLSNALKFKPDDKIDDKKDVKRIDILVGQIVAGNDNDRVKKECKELIKKCVDNGSITRHRGMDLLFQIE